MIGTTIGAILDGEYVGLDPSHRLYVVRDGATVFYVGQSKRGAVNRVLEHLGRGQFPHLDLLGLVVKANLPGALNWVVEFAKPRYKTVVAPIDDKAWATLSPVVRFSGTREGFEFYSDLDTDRTEKELIQELKPCLNVTHNKDRQPLPDCYHGIGVDLSVTVSDFVPFA